MLSSSHLPTSKRLNSTQRDGNPLLKLSVGAPMTNSVYILPSGLTKKVIANSRVSMQAAVWEKAETVLCVACSKDLDNDPEAYEVMYADYQSPSGWKCIKCKGTSRYTQRA